MSYVPTQPVLPVWTWTNQSGFSKQFNLTTIDSDGLEWWVPLTPKGWRGPGALRSTYLVRPGEDGSWPAEVRLGPDAITLEGTIFASDSLGVRKAEAYLAQLALCVTGDGTLERYTNIPAASWSEDVIRFVRIDGAIDVKSRDDVYGVDFQIPLLSYDPHLYSEAVHTSTGAVSNAGDAYTPVQLTVSGAVAATVVTLASSGAQIKFAGTPPATVVIDTRAKTIVDGSGNPVPGAVSLPNMFWVAPGSDTVSIAGGGTLSVAWRDSWI